MEGSQFAGIPLDSPICTDSSDMLSSVDSPELEHNRQEYQARLLPNSLRYEHDGWFAGWLAHMFEFEQGDPIYDSAGLFPEGFTVDKTRYYFCPVYRLSSDGSAFDWCPLTKAVRQQGSFMELGYVDSADAVMMAGGKYVHEEGSAYAFISGYTFSEEPWYVIFDKNSLEIIGCSENVDQESVELSFDTERFCWGYSFVTLGSTFTDRVTLQYGKPLRVGEDLYEYSYTRDNGHRWGDYLQYKDGIVTSDEASQGGTPANGNTLNLDYWINLVTEYQVSYSTEDYPCDIEWLSASQVKSYIGNNRSEIQVTATNVTYTEKEIAQNRYGFSIVNANLGTIGNMQYPAIMNAIKNYRYDTVLKVNLPIWISTVISISGTQEIHIDYAEPQIMDTFIMLRFSGSYTISNVSAIDSSKGIIQFKSILGNTYKAYIAAGNNISLVNCGSISRVYLANNMVLFRHSGNRRFTQYDLSNIRVHFSNGSYFNVGNICLQDFTYISHEFFDFCYNGATSWFNDIYSATRTITNTFGTFTFNVCTHLSVDTNLRVLGIYPRLLEPGVYINNAQAYNKSSIPIGINYYFHGNVTFSGAFSGTINNWELRRAYDNFRYHAEYMSLECIYDNGGTSETYDDSYAAIILEGYKTNTASTGYNAITGGSLRARIVYSSDWPENGVFNDFVPAAFDSNITSSAVTQRYYAEFFKGSNSAFVKIGSISGLDKVYDVNSLINNVEDTLGFIQISQNNINLASYLNVTMTVPNVQVSINCSASISCYTRNYPAMTMVAPKYVVSRSSTSINSLSCTLAQNGSRNVSVATQYVFEESSNTHVITIYDNFATSRFGSILPYSLLIEGTNVHIAQHDTAAPVNLNLTFTAKSGSNLFLPIPKNGTLLTFSVGVTINFGAKTIIFDKGARSPVLSSYISSLDTQFYNCDPYFIQFIEPKTINNKTVNGAYMWYSTNYDDKTGANAVAVYACLKGTAFGHVSFDYDSDVNIPTDSNTVAVRLHNLDKMSNKMFIAQNCPIFSERRAFYIDRDVLDDSTMLYGKKLINFEVGSFYKDTKTNNYILEVVLDSKAGTTNNETVYFYPMSKLSGVPPHLKNGMISDAGKSSDDCEPIILSDDAVLNIRTYWDVKTLPRLTSAAVVTKQDWQHGLMQQVRANDIAVSDIKGSMLQHLFIRTDIKNRGVIPNTYLSAAMLDADYNFTVIYRMQFKEFKLDTTILPKLFDSNRDSSLYGDTSLFATEINYDALFMTLQMTSSYHIDKPAYFANLTGDNINNYTLMYVAGSINSFVYGYDPNYDEAAGTFELDSKTGTMTNDLFDVEVLENTGDAAQLAVHGNDFDNGTFLLSGIYRVGKEFDEEGNVLAWWPAPMYRGVEKYEKFYNDGAFAGYGETLNMEYEGSSTTLDLDAVYDFKNMMVFKVKDIREPVEED